MDEMTSTVLVNATIETQVPSQLSDVVLGGIISGAIAGLILFLAVTIATVYFFNRRRKVNLESPEDSVDTFTYVKQVNPKDGNWTLPPGTTLSETSTLPVSRSINPGHVEHNMSAKDRLILPEISCHDPDKEASFSPQEVVASRSVEAEVVVEKIRKCCSTPEVAKFDEPEPVSETGSSVELEPKPVSATGSRIGLDPKAVTGTGSWDELEPKAVPETGSTDTLSVDSLNPSLSEDYCNRVIDEAFGAIDNFAYSDFQSDTE